MFCPECQAEYRQGFTRCADCDVDLVYELPPEPGQASSAQSPNELDGLGVDLQLIWKGVEQNACIAGLPGSSEKRHRVQSCPNSRMA